MSNTVSNRQSLRGSVASALGFAHFASLVAPAAERREPTLAADKPSDAERHPDGKFKSKETPGDENDDARDEDEEGDDDADDEEMSTKARGSVRSARMRERSRCAAIMGAPEAARNVQLAAHLAFNTDLSRSVAIATLQKGASSGGLAAAMATQPSPKVGPGAERPTRTSMATIGASWDVIMGKYKR